jgi:hypothetical protein
MFPFSALAGSEWSASRLGRFTPIIYWFGDWVGPRTGLDDVKRMKRNELNVCVVWVYIPHLESDTGVRRWGLALSMGPNGVGFT